MYRKYRSAELSDVVGQDHVTRTLASAIKAGKLSHAYLFTGPRGVGKTSVARILARAINQVSPGEDLAQYLDIIEIDAASNRGIDEIRALRDKVAVTPAKLQYKVYIIDEAHMLTREAFNALLKTLEEPPEHVVFILATTESHKLPDTIISRTQRYDFHALTEEELASHLKFIADSEKVDITDEAIHLIAQIANGGMRDAISLLDQLAVLESTIDEETTSQFLGLASAAEINDLLQTCYNSHAADAIGNLKKILARGVSANELLRQLQQAARLELIKYIELSDTAKVDFYVRSLDILHTAVSQQSYSSQASIPVEVAIAKLSLGNELQFNTQPQTIVSKASKPTEQTSVENSTTEVKIDSSMSKDSVSIDDTDAISLCDNALSKIKEHNNSLYALLRSGNAQVNGNVLQVACRFAFHKNRIEEHHNRALIEKTMSNVFGKPIQLQCVLESAPAVETVDEPISTDSELVNSAMAILGGELVE